jgi:diaminohydroxyphosphoribosylaminopyrimidine deaminase/5-amino-6-(5-phosphoribosylamino)uracil reductase
VSGVPGALAARVADGEVFSAAESEAMAAALEAAALGVRGANPLVGAVILDAAGHRLAVGYHRGAGTPHAEADAIAQLPAGITDLSGATILVTLEPCNHHGRTGPCSEAIIAAGIGRAVYAVDDPHGAAAGGGERLRQAGLAVRSGLLADAATQMNRRWLLAVKAARPFITLHIAQTLDGRIAAADGTSQWITSPQSLADNHAIRSRIDAILVGTQTVLVDNPRLTARNPDGSASRHQPLRVAMGLRDVPADAAIRGEATGGGADSSGFLQLRTRDPLLAATELHHRGVRHLMVEGGSRVAGAFLKAGLVDELILYLAPTLLGAGVPALADLGIGTLAQAQHWIWDNSSGGAAVALGNDLRLHLTPAADAAIDKNAGGN